ncbi:MAG TPA: ribonuclease HII [candidate division Zixibacteria bacterium]|nr:ribonuclease HII [candidate division Zixibacteria bacterium]
MAYSNSRAEAVREEMLKEIKIDEFLERHGYTVIAGVDEAGRGPLAGPVVAAAVIIPERVTIRGLNDSKKLTASQREELFEEIAALEIPVSVGISDNKTIDQINILRASLMAMRRSVCGLSERPQCCLVDGNQKIPNTSIPQMTIIGGDRRCEAIMAASIVAKVTRDRIMLQYAERYTEFSFAEHFGYPTPGHLAELKKHGPSPIHRRSFKPVAEALKKKGLPQMAALF